MSRYLVIFINYAHSAPFHNITSFQSKISPNPFHTQFCGMYLLKIAKQIAIFNTHKHTPHS